MSFATNNHICEAHFLNEFLKKVDTKADFYNNQNFKLKMVFIEMIENGSIESSFSLFMGMFNCS